ncbi:MAG: hypothetical protein WC763_01765 [Candidatus Paceibacterota bacterium]|jgi:hypothetical protein
MKTYALTVILIAIFVAAMLPLLVSNWKKGSAARARQRRLSFVRDQMSVIDRLISEGRRQHGDDWMSGPQGKNVVLDRFRLHEEYCELEGPDIRVEDLRMKELMSSAAGQ